MKHPVMHFEIISKDSLGLCAFRDPEGRTIGLVNPGDLAPIAALFRSLLETLFGQLQIGVDARGILREVWLPNRGPAIESGEPFPRAARSGIDAVKTQLNEYFAGRRRVFDLLLDPRGSGFEQQVWAQLCAIPYGATTSYGAIAAELGLTNGARAVGRANGTNPIPIIIPCHRVIGKDGQLTGYGGGLPLKRTLLELEGVLPPSLICGA